MTVVILAVLLIAGVRVSIKYLERTLQRLIIMSSLLPITIDDMSRTPIYDQIEAQIKTLIIGGNLPPGTALPSIRKLATSLSCSVITTRRSYQNLEQKGYIKTVQGKGTFVNEMAQTDQTKQKEEAVESGLKHAIESGFRYGFTTEELEAMFLKLLRQGGN